MTSIMRSLALGASVLALGLAGQTAVAEGPECSGARITVGTMTPPFIGGPAIARRWGRTRS